VKLIRIELSGKVDAYVNPDHVAYIEAQGDKRTIVCLANSKILDIDDSADRVAFLLQTGRSATATGSTLHP